MMSTLLLIAGFIVYAQCTASAAQMVRNMIRVTASNAYLNMWYITQSTAPVAYLNMLFKGGGEEGDGLKDGGRRAQAHIFRAQTYIIANRALCRPHIMYVNVGTRSGPRGFGKNWHIDPSCSLWEIGQMRPRPDVGLGTTALHTMQSPPRPSRGGPWYKCQEEIHGSLPRGAQVG